MGANAFVRFQQYFFLLEILSKNPDGLEMREIQDRYTKRFGVFRSERTIFDWRDDIKRLFGIDVVVEYPSYDYTYREDLPKPTYKIRNIDAYKEGLNISVQTILESLAREGSGLSDTVYNTFQFMLTGVLPESGEMPDKSHPFLRPKFIDNPMSFVLLAMETGIAIEVENGEFIFEPYKVYPDNDNIWMAVGKYYPYGHKRKGEIKAIRINQIKRSFTRQEQITYRLQDCQIPEKEQ